VLGDETFYGSKIESDLSSWIDWVSVFEVVFVKPVIQLPVPQDLCSGSLRDAHSVSDVVIVAVRDKNVVSRNFVHIDSFGQFIGRDEGIKQQRLTASHNREAGMPVVRQFHSSTYSILTVPCLTNS
jgi:hypothetical protein